jgi:AAA+ ATPase superfamily predicted ATPase
MIYLIGGPPRVGKSILARKLIKQKTIPSFSLDYLYNLEQIRNISAFEKAELVEKAKLFYPTLKDLLLDVKRRSKDCVIEGEVLLPEFIPELSNKYELRCVFIDLSQTSLDQIINKADHFNWPKWKLENGMEDEIKDLAKKP